MTKTEFKNSSYRDCWMKYSLGKPNSTKRVTSVMDRWILGKNECIILDRQGRVWTIPEIRNRYGETANTRISYPLELHFDARGVIEYAVHLHPYHDPALMTPEDETMSQMMGTLPANAGFVKRKKKK